MGQKRSAYEAEQAAAYFAGRCRSNLADRVAPDAPITTQTLAHGDGDFSAQAFHTVWSPSDRKAFARVVVDYDTYISGDGALDTFIYGVEYYPDGHHENWNFYELDRFDE